MIQSAGAILLSTGIFLSLLDARFRRRASTWLLVIGAVLLIAGHYGQG